MRPAASRRDPIAVVVVEDHDDTREMLRETFEHAGMDVRACASAHEALGAVTERTADVVVTDLRLAGGEAGGAELAATLRNDPTTAGIALLAVSGELEATPDVVRFVDAYLRKPVDLATLPDLVEALADRVSTPPEPRRPRRRRSGVIRASR
ncbi:MAG: response regulator [Myxococcota bacterium]|nr:response regulator [Myxococcota bacterium]